MPENFTDTHAHLSYVRERLSPDEWDSLVPAMGQKGLRILDAGVEYTDFNDRQAHLGSLSFVRLAAGIWPDVPTLPSVDEALAALETSVRHPACIAVGECGLDYHWMNGSPAEQAELFGGQLVFAEKYNKPVLIHSREAFADTLSLVRPYASKIPVIIHCFSYDADAAAAFLAAGCWLSFAGNCTYRKQEALQQALISVPANRLLLETDAPYMNPTPGRGKASTPLDIGRTYAFAAALRGCPLDVLSDLVSDNAKAVFGPNW
ncbi:MAG: TatD family hydrolase [Spirochaetes bacterium]|nr:TatD family hydrolase [Spirochaetota bacterium]MBU0953985.1 TatD family hydrolase [Spirochaetota bacterium]